MHWPNMPLLRRWLRLAMVALLLPMAAGADEDSEREHLARIRFEIQRLQVQVQEASRQAPQGARVKFRYDWLLADLDGMRRGIEDHLEAPIQPRRIEPLRGEYRQ